MPCNGPFCFRLFRRKKRPPSQASWSYLPEPAVDRIVTVLKETSRWRRDGPSLRQLNHFWCLQISQHIFAVFPGNPQQLMWEDVSSLTKFPNLTSLNMERFVPPLESVSSALKRSTSWSREAQRRQDSFLYQQSTLEKMINTIVDLPHLSHLTVSSELLYHQRHGRYLWQRLKGITSLQISGKKDTTSGTPALIDMVLEDFPWVKSIDLVGPRFLNSSQLSMLEEKETVKLRDVTILEPFASIPGLVSLSARELRLEDVDILESMTQLNSLTFFVDTRKLLKQLSNSQALSHLTELSMHSVARQREIKEAFFQECHHLQSLSLEHFRFAGADLVRHLPGLTRLELLKCSPTGGVLFLSQLNRLETLSVVCGYSQEEELTGMASANIKLPKLKVLHLKPVTSDALFNAVTKFKKLEVVGVHCGAVSSQMFRDLECLPRLRVLSVHFASRALDRSTSLLSLSFLTSLEKLSIGTKVATSHLRKHQIESLLKKAPHLTIELT